MGTSMPMREKDSSDFDLEAFIDLFDEALASNDPSVKQTLHHLMIIAALARNHDKHSEREGPLRRLFQEHRDLIRRIERLELGKEYPGPGFGPAPFQPPYQPAPYIPSVISSPNTNWPPHPGTYPPGTIFAQNLADITQRINGGQLDSPVAERVEVESWKTAGYTGSTVGGSEC